MMKKEYKLLTPFLIPLCSSKGKGCPGGFMQICGFETSWIQCILPCIPLHPCSAIPGENLDMLFDSTKEGTVKQKML
jgi:hypothetical protein